VTLALAALVASPAQRRRNFLLEHRLDETADAAQDPRFNRSNQAPPANRGPASAEVVLFVFMAWSPPSAATPGFGCGFSTGDYATPISNHIPDGTDGFRATVYAIVGQYGTHIDPPAHFAPDGATMDRIPLKQMIFPLVVIDETPLLDADPAHALSVADIEAWERQHGRIPSGSFVALRTDMSKDFDGNPERFRRSPFPAWSLPAIRFVYEQRDAVATGHEAMDTETWLLRAGYFQIAMMANLDQVPATGALIVVAWPKVENGLGFAARAFTILP